MDWFTKDLSRSQVGGTATRLTADIVVESLRVSASSSGGDAASNAPARRQTDIAQSSAEEAVPMPADGEVGRC